MGNQYFRCKGMEPIEYTLLGLAIVLFGAWCFVMSFHLLAICYGKWKLHKHPTMPPEKGLPGVSILKPLTGVDPHLYSNLETFFKMEYPKYELLFCVGEEGDPAIMVAQSLIEKYPNVDSQLLIGGKIVGINPKINNMMLAYEAAKYDLILISDSGLRMSQDGLLDMVLHIERDNVGLVHQMPYVCDRKGFAGVLEKVYFGTQHAKMYLYANALGINCTTGMSCIMRKEILEDSGGLKVFGQYLAEDFFLAQATLQKGWQILLASQVAQQNPGTYSVTQFQNRIIRWTKLRAAMLPQFIFLEPLSECLTIGLLGSWSVVELFDWSPLGFFLVHTLLWFLQDYILLLVVNNGPITFTKFDFLIGWIFRELTSITLMIRAHASPTIEWRSRRFKLQWGGLVTELKPKTPEVSPGVYHHRKTFSV
ncbi:unnamed protein product [Owenia fusiformis]|uniref:ceramide glucosyltransferase n=1 Tax=Owenia fusiformis TaxID=6347 RepID=A0A8J1YAA0_OWEFU|nr:unnamed protein product [Owenia fusiformis]